MDARVEYRILADGSQAEMLSGEHLQEALHLQGDLEKALKRANNTFKGDFYHAKLHPSAPNPCLSISGLGMIGLPLGEHDAKRIISVASLAPFGHGERTVVDKTVRDTWEIEPANVTFMNAAWSRYVDTTVCAEVCASLGVSISAPKMELYKLLLYETGSHFLPHQDTQKANGMFATVIIILPSAYEGGQLVVSHASATKTIDFSSDSSISTAVLGWYTDVKHEVKPITSGYRLALSYNLIHTTPKTELCPSLPTAENVTEPLTNYFRTWRQRLDRYEPVDENVVAVVLDHEYSLMNMSDGPTFLKGADAHNFSLIRPIAESFGFILGFASLEQHVTGPADDHGGGYHSRGRYYDDSEEDGYDDYGPGGTPGMMEVNERHTTLTSMVGMDGHPLLGMVNSLSIDEEYLVPEEPFEDAEPDETEYEGYMGNGAGELEHWYRRTALVIVNANGQDELRFDVEGLPLAFRTLAETCVVPPSTDNLKWVQRILRRTSIWTKENMLAMINYALHWRSINLWEDSSKSSLCSLENVDVNILLESCRVFSFGSVRLSLEGILARSSSKHSLRKINLLQMLPQTVNAAEGETLRSWSEREMQKALESFHPNGAEDCEAIIALIKLVGLRLFMEQMLPSLRAKTQSFDFWLTLHTKLIEKRQTILDSLPAANHPDNDSLPDHSTNANRTESSGDSNQPVTLHTLDELTTLALRLASQEWTNVPQAQTSIYSHHHVGPQPNTIRANRMLLVIEHCERSSHADIRDLVLHDALNLPGLLIPIFTGFYTPLVPRLLAVLKTVNKCITDSPYSAFAHTLIGKYLAQVLGKKGHVVDCGLRKVGCGCADCGILDGFILDTRQSETVIRMNQQRRRHLEFRLSDARDLCDYQEIKTGSPHGLQVKKKQAVVQAANWEARLRSSKKFIELFGPTETVIAIMGNRYTDMQNALKGYQYALRDTPAHPLASESSLSTIRPTTAANTSTTTTNSQPSGGQKRKSAPLKQLGVIDLTSDDSS